MIKFIQNIGDYFSSNYFDEDFGAKVLAKCGYGAEDIKEFNNHFRLVRHAEFTQDGDRIAHHLPVAVAAH